MDDEKHHNDLPLMANTSDLLVHHYVFKLFCDFEKASFDGWVFIYLEPVKIGTCDRNSMETLTQTYLSHQLNKENQDKYNKEFICIFDCCDIVVNDIIEVDMTMADFEQNQFNACKDKLKEKMKLKFSVDNWSLKIWKPGVFCPCCFPRFIKIMYQTKPEGKSLLWVKDQDGKPAVYTYGAHINNRSLFPCQEPPHAMATWEAYISTNSDAVVLMSGDNNPIISSHDGIATYYYYTKMILPLSTLALAVGFWQVEDNFECEPSDFKVRIRICAAASLLSSAVEEFSAYIFSSVRAAEAVFGFYPFPRIDFLIVPRGFCSLGMASPNIIFLSQSLLSGDGSMCCRIAHEIAHAWFGLLIGASDWTEEWLSEGFATFYEDIIHAKAISLLDSEKNDFCEMKAYLRAKTLIAEAENTIEKELNVLRPNKGKDVFKNVDGVEAVVLKNGRNPDKGFMQVHYIKGFFLLNHLSIIVGLPSFLQCVNMYIQKYRGKLVDSVEMLNFFASTFSETCEKTLSVESIISEWLHASEVPEAVSFFTASLSNSIFNTASQEVIKWKKLNYKCLMKKNPKRRKYDTGCFVKLTSNSILILLDMLLDEDHLAASVLKLLAQVYNVERKNAEIRHKWCELVVKHRYYAGYTSLERFMKNDLAMGVYLYGELILNGTKSQKAFAEECFKSMRDEMEPSAVIVVENMLEAFNEHA